MMLYPAMRDLLKKIPSRYQMVNMVAHRAREISAEAEMAGEPLDDKPVSIAIREVAEGKLDEQIEQIQLEGIKKTVIACYENVPLYKKSFDDAGFDPYAVTSLDDLRWAPFVTKQDLRDAYPYGGFAVPMSEVKRIHASSGTTGKATVVGYTASDLALWDECVARARTCAGGTREDIVQVCYVPNLTDNTVRTFWRNCNNGVTFGKWSESGAVKTVNSIAPDASGEVTLPNATTSKAGLVRLAAEEDVLNEAPQTAVCTQLIYEINEFRRKSTAYQVGDKVGCAFQYERFLECTKAGKTSAELLDTRNVTHGHVIADGMVEWTVRTHVRSVNGNVAGADGNVLVDVGVKTVNGNRPDGSGNVSIQAGIELVRW